MVLIGEGLAVEVDLEIVLGGIEVGGRGIVCVEIFYDFEQLL